MKIIFENEKISIITNHRRQIHVFLDYRAVVAWLGRSAYFDAIALALEQYYIRSRTFRIVLRYHKMSTSPCFQSPISDFVYDG